MLNSSLDIQSYIMIFCTKKQNVTLSSICITEGNDRERHIVIRIKTQM